MPTARRRLVALTTAFVLAAALPAAAGIGPAVVDTKDSYVPPRAFEMSSSASGTIYGVTSGAFGRLWLVQGTMTTGSPRVDLGDRPRVFTEAATPTINGTRVAIPQGTTFDAPIATVRQCAVGTCPTMSTFTVTAGYRYLGNGGDVALVASNTTHALGLAPWNGTAFTPIALPEFFEPETATADATYVLLHGGGRAVLVRRSDGAALLDVDANEAVLTPSWVVWYQVASPTEELTTIRAVPRAALANPPSTLASLAGAPDFNAFTATDGGVAWLDPEDDGSNRLWSVPIGGGTPVLYPRPIDSSALSPAEATNNVLVNDRRAAVPGLYRVTPGSTSGTLTGLLPTPVAITVSASLSNQRVAYTDDMTEDTPVFLKGAPNGVPESTEQTLSEASDTNVALSGPYVAFGRAGHLVTGRAGSALRTTPIPSGDLARVSISGRRALVTGGVNSRMVDVITGAVTNLGHTYAALFGDYLVTLNYDTGRIDRKNLATGATQLVRAAVPGCTTLCVNEEWWSLQPWGHEVAYAYLNRFGGLVQGLWDGTALSGEALPGVSVDGEGFPSFYEIRYWSGLLQVYTTDFDVVLYDLRNDTGPHLVEADSDSPMGIDGHNVGWRRLSDLRVYVRPVTDIVPGHVPSPRYLGGNVPGGFAPGTATDEWKPRFLVSQDVSWTLTLRSGSSTGAVVRTLTGSSEHGEASPVWDGTNGATDVPQGTYHWTLAGTGTSPGGLPLLQASGSATPISGTVYVSRSALGAPVVNAPTRSTDVSATSSFPVSWSAPAGAPAGTTYTLQRSYNGGAYATVASGITTLSRTYAASVPGTYRFRVWATDPSGRAGAISASDVTMVPYDDDSSGMTYAGSWGSGTSSLLYGGTHHRSTAAGATFSFKATGTQIHLIGIKAASYGQFQVSVDGGAYSGLVDAYSATTRYRQVLWSRTGLSNSLHTVKIRVYGTSGRPAVGIDGVAFLR